MLLLNIQHSLTFSYNLLSIESLAYRLIAQPIILCALYDKMAAETLCEMERPYLSDTCGFFCKERGRLCIGLLRVCASVLAQQNNLAVSLTRELQELISRLDRNALHLIQTRKDLLLEGGSLI